MDCINWMKTKNWTDYPSYNLEWQINLKRMTRKEQENRFHLFWLNVIRAKAENFHFRKNWRWKTSARCTLINIHYRSVQMENWMTHQANHRKNKHNKLMVTLSLCPCFTSTFILHFLRHGTRVPFLKQCKLQRLQHGYFSVCAFVYLYVPSC